MDWPSVPGLCVNFEINQAKRCSVWPWKKTKPILDFPREQPDMSTEKQKKSHSDSNISHFAQAEDLHHEHYTVLLTTEMS